RLVTVASEATGNGTARRRRCRCLQPLAVQKDIRRGSKRRESRTPASAKSSRARCCLLDAAVWFSPRLQLLGMLTEMSEHAMAFLRPACRLVRVGRGISEQPGFEASDPIVECQPPLLDRW